MIIVLTIKLTYPARKIYLATAHAWYVLGTPSEQYLPLYREFWSQHRIFHLAVTYSLSNQSLTMRDFVSYLETPEQQFNLLATAIVGKPLSEENLASETTVGILHKEVWQATEYIFLRHSTFFSSAVLCLTSIRAL